MDRPVHDKPTPGIIERLAAAARAFPLLGRATLLAISSPPRR